MFRTLTTWLLAACLGTIASVGHGLHLLEGCGHQAATPTACCAAHGCTHSSPAEATDEPAARRQHGGAHHDCLICRVLAQGQTTAAGQAAVLSASVAEYQPASVPARRAVQAARSHSPRGPPAACQG